MFPKNKAQIHFLGAVGTVTGSKYIIRTHNKTILVDCGLFQGLKKLRLLNWEKLAVDPAEIDLVLLTHGHLDHCGYLPCLIKKGFKGEIWCTEPTREITKIILEDSAKIQEEDAERANEQGYSVHKPAKPLYNLTDVKNTLPHLKKKTIDNWIPITKNISCRYRYNGHIIGATFIELKINENIFVFSGDIGRDNDLLMFPPQKPQEADVLFIESTYGDRFHPNHSEEILIKTITEAVERKGTIIIPSFAVERTQLLMYLLWQLKKQGKIPPVPVFMDSPMGSNVLEVFQQYGDWHKLSMEECAEMCRDIQLVQSVEETYQVMAINKAKIVIAGSGMASGGRVLIYFQKYLEDKNATILLAGYQAEGTRGRQLLEGAREIKMYGEYYSVHAKIELVEGLSAHADQNELIKWAGEIKKAPEKVFIVHGEAQAADALRVKLKTVYGWNCEIPAMNDIAEVNI